MHNVLRTPSSLDGASFPSDLYSQFELSRFLLELFVANVALATLKFIYYMQISDRNSAIVNAVTHTGPLFPIFGLMVTVLVGLAVAAMQVCSTVPC